MQKITPRYTLAFALVLALVSAPGLALAGDEVPTVVDTMLNPNAFDEGRAETHPFDRLGLFAGSRSFRMGREDPVHNVEGGASFRFIGNWFLTGSYRILDYELDASSLDIENAGPLFGVRLQF